MTIRKFTAGLLIAGFVSTASISTAANASTYIAIDGTSVDVENNLDDELNPVGLRFRLGIRLNETFDLEGHMGFSSDDRTTAYDELGTNYGGVFLKGYVPVGFNSALYALAGYSSVEITQTVDAREFTDERGGFSYGFGLETQISERADISADYVRYVRDEGLFEDVSAISFGLKFYF